MTSLPDLLSLYRSDARVARVADGLREKSARVQIAGTIREKGFTNTMMIREM